MAIPDTAKESLPFYTTSSAIPVHGSVIIKNAGEDSVLVVLTEIKGVDGVSFAASYPDTVALGKSDSTEVKVRLNIGDDIMNLHGKKHNKSLNLKFKYKSINIV